MFISKWRYELQLKRAEERGKKEAMKEAADLEELREKVAELEIVVGCMRRRILKMTKENGSEASEDMENLWLPF